MWRRCVEFDLTEILRQQAAGERPRCVAITVRQLERCPKPARQGQPVCGHHYVTDRIPPPRKEITTVPNRSELISEPKSRNVNVSNRGSEGFTVGKPRKGPKRPAGAVASERSFRTSDQSVQPLTPGAGLDGKDRSSARDWPDAPRCGQRKKNGRPCGSLVRTELGYATCWSHGKGRGRTSTPMQRMAAQ